MINGGVKDIKFDYKLKCLAFW